MCRAGNSQYSGTGILSERDDGPLNFWYLTSTVVGVRTLEPGAKQALPKSASSEMRRILWVRWGHWLCGMMYASCWDLVVIDAVFQYIVRQRVWCGIYP